MTRVPTYIRLFVYLVPSLYFMPRPSVLCLWVTTRDIYTQIQGVQQRLGIFHGKPFCQSSCRKMRSLRVRLIFGSLHSLLSAASFYNIQSLFNSVVVSSPSYRRKDTLALALKSTWKFPLSIKPRYLASKNPPSSILYLFIYLTKKLLRVTKWSLHYHIDPPAREKGT